jgi:hypothetical protein
MHGRIVSADKYTDFPAEGAVQLITVRRLRFRVVLPWRWERAGIEEEARDELVERTFVHTYETGALRRWYVRGKQSVQKMLLLQAAACNLALLLRKMVGAGTPLERDGAIRDLLNKIAVSRQPRSALVECIA